MNLMSLRFFKPGYRSWVVIWIMAILVLWEGIAWMLQLFLSPQQAASRLPYLHEVLAALFRYSSTLAEQGLSRLAMQPLVLQGNVAWSGSGSTHERGCLARAHVISICCLLTDGSGYWSRTNCVRDHPQCGVGPNCYGRVCHFLPDHHPYVERIEKCSTRAFGAYAFLWSFIDCTIYQMPAALSTAGTIFWYENSCSAGGDLLHRCGINGSSRRTRRPDGQFVILRSCPSWYVLGHHHA